MYFSNKVVWVTGASSGIGKALALELNKKGAKLILSSRKEEALEAVRSLCIDKEQVKIVALDLENYSDLHLKAKEAIACFGSIDILINNGGISQRSLANNTSIAVDKQLMDINYLGTVALTKAILPHFIAKNKGVFAVTTSIVGKIGTPLRSSYAASKHALHGFFDSLRAENHHNNISVTLLCPGFVQTNISKNALTGNGQALGKMDAATENGMSAEKCAIQMLKAIKNNRKEVYIAGSKEKLGVYVKRFLPNLFAVLVRKMSVT
ncbi:SDR family oxidoreductase [uncultured Polaribacter sp.]|uniref:SDR family oxidoreductase n=1 Tax=uncultured Polaribacter sp. TaxID=174711 RepID=UPI002605FCDC|nr:SDR family oxidoreductase [uncultured Polaribacter sp.]